MKREHLTGHRFHPANLIVQGHAEGVSGTLHGVPAPRMVHEDAAHHFGGDGQEVRAVLPIDPILVDQPQVGFVNERGRLQGVVAPLPTQIACRARPQVSVNQLGRGRRAPERRHVPRRAARASPLPRWWLSLRWVR